MTAWLAAMWGVTLELAPWLLVGAALAAVLHVILPPGLIRRQLRGTAGVLKAVAIGVPLPLCSCGVIPAGLGLKKDGASDGAAVGFLISTPQTGVDSILVSASFLGWPFALFKVASAAILGLVGGLLTHAVADEASSHRGASEVTTDAARPSARAGFEHGVMLLRTIWRWLVFGVIASAALTVFLPPDAFSILARDGGLGAMLLSLVVSIPLYVCATASVPIASALVAGGMPVGAALVFLMAGPATNVATIGAVYRAFGARVLAVYLGTIILGTIVLATVFDAIVGPTAVTSMHHHDHGSPLAVVAALILITAIAWFAFDDLRALAARTRTRRAASSTIDVGVSGMTCQGCVRKLEKRLTETPGVDAAEVQLPPGRAVVSGRISRGQVEDVIRAAGFEPRAAPPGSARPSPEPG
jgi:uncharacterized membrane protein YraQ (UPF0718 family)/copper chaperone CopZ